MNNNTIKIDSYLQGEMSPADKAAFEEQLSFDKDLREELAIHQHIINAATSAGLKASFAAAIHKKIVTRRLIRWGSAIIIIAAALFFVWKSGLFSDHEHEPNGEKHPTIERFNINPSADTIIETHDGVVFAIPAHAFATEANSIELEIKTALNAYDILHNGLSTRSNGRMLNTAGMFYINAVEGGKTLSLTKDIAVSVPTANVNPDMQIFDGVENEGLNSTTVNWVNPRPVDNNLRTYDVNTLDFYPPRYIPTLKALAKAYQNKKYTDSLYYSFSGYPHGAKHPEAAPPVEVKEEPKPRPNDLPQDTSKNPDSKFWRNVDAAAWPLRMDSSIQQDLADSTREFTYQIDPAIIKAIWDKKFNNTIIATKEFEERLRYMHSLCSSEYLELYLKNLNKPLYLIDKLCADHSSGDVKKKFLEFAAQKKGQVMIASDIQQKLTDYFQKKSRAYKEAAAKTWQKYQAKLEALNNSAYRKRGEAAFKELKRTEENFNQELCSNLTAAYAQLDIHRSCNDTILPPTTQYYNTTIRTTGWKNLDLYVFDATENRESMVYTDPNTGKTAKLTYREVNIKIDNPTQYDRVFVYLIPDSLSHFQRMPQQDNGFKEKLNSLFRYDAVAMAYKGGQAYFFKQAGLQPKEYQFKLSAISDVELRAELRRYPLNKGTELRTEFEYQLFEQQETARRLQYMKDVEFRAKVAASIFDCGEASTPVVIESNPK